MKRLIKQSPSIGIFFLLLMMSQAANVKEKKAKKDSTEPASSPAVTEKFLSIEKQAEEQANTINRLSKEVEQLKKQVESANKGIIPRFQNNWDILMAAAAFGLLMGLALNLILPRKFWKLLEKEYPIPPPSAPNEFRFIKLENGLQELEKSVGIIYEKLRSFPPLQTGGEEAKESANESADVSGQETSNEQTDLNRDEYLYPTTSKEASALTKIGTLSPSNYKEAVTAVASVSKISSAQPDYRFPGKLVETNQGRFLIISIADGSAKQHLTLPAWDHMGGADEFDYYKDFFECDRPLGGTIFVVRPATVHEDEQQGIWTLSSPGKLEIRR